MVKNLQRVTSAEHVTVATITSATLVTFYHSTTRNIEGKGKSHPRKGHELPEEE